MQNYFKNNIINQQTQITRDIPGPNSTHGQIKNVAKSSLLSTMAKFVNAK